MTDNIELRINDLEASVVTVGVDVMHMQVELSKLCDLFADAMVKLTRIEDSIDQILHKG